MMHIEGEHGSHDGDDHLFEMRIRDTHQLQTTLTGACEDDCEVTVPYIGVCPDESTHQDGSAISFGGITAAEASTFDDQMALFMAEGFDFSTHHALIDYRIDHFRDPYTGKLLKTRTMGTIPTIASRSSRRISSARSETIQSSGDEKHGNQR